MFARLKKKSKFHISNAYLRTSLLNYKKVTMKNKTGLLLLILLIITNTAFTQENSVNGNSQAVKGASLELPQIQVIPIKDTKNDQTI